MSTPNTIASPVGAIPARRECEFCHKPLKTISLTVCGRIFPDLPCYASCGCEASREKYESIDRDRPMTKQELYLQAGIGTKYQTAVADCAAYVEAVKAGQSVFVAGGVGTGKSMLAAAIAKKLISEGAKVLFCNAAIISQKVKDSFNDGGSDYWVRMCEIPVLVIDDLGKDNPTEWSVSFWYSVVEARNASGLPTVVTTNYDGGELVSRFAVNGNVSDAKAIVSRLRGGALVVKKDGSDLRLDR